MRGNGSITNVYRAMKPDESGLPMLGTSASTLGARQRDIPFGEDGLVRPCTGGMSVTPDRPDRIHLPLRPQALGGGGKHPAYGINVERLRPSLQFRRDPANPVNHGFIEPAEPMLFRDYEAALHATAAHWERVT